jgi:hypothetical protein
VNRLGVGLAGGQLCGLAGLGDEPIIPSPQIIYIAHIYILTRSLNIYRTLLYFYTK